MVLLLPYPAHQHRDIPTGNAIDRFVNNPTELEACVVGQMATLRRGSFDVDSESQTGMHSRQPCSSEDVVFVCIFVPLCHTSCLALSQSGTAAVVTRVTSA